MAHLVFMSIRNFINLTVLQGYRALKLYLVQLANTHTHTHTTDPGTCTGREHREQKLL